MSDRALDNIKTRLTQSLRIPEKLLVKWCKMIDEVRKNACDKLDDVLGPLITELETTIAYETVVDLNKINQNPPSRLILPIVLTYNPDIYRDGSYIRDPMEKYEFIVSHNGGGYTMNDYHRVMM
jgi:hypothetical protein